MPPPHKFHVKLPDSCDAPFRGLEALCDDKKILHVEYLMETPTSALFPQNELAVELNCQLRAYLRNALHCFNDLRQHLLDAPTLYQQKVRAAVIDIPYGETLTYGEIAEQIGYSNKAGMSVGTACRKNPLGIVVPCYRAVAANGLGGFAGNKYVENNGAQLKIKRWLIKHERV